MIMSNTYFKKIISYDFYQKCEKNNSDDFGVDHILGTNLRNTNKNIKK